MKIITPAALYLFLGALPAASQDDAPPAGMRVLGTAAFQTPSTIQGMAFSLDSRRLAVGTQQDGILVWDLETAKVVDRIPVEGGVSHLRYLADGRRLLFMTMMNHATKQGDETVVWDLQDRKALFRFPTGNHYGKFELSPDEKLLLTPDRKNHRDLPGVLGWDLETGKPAPGLEEVARHPPNVTYRVATMTFTADGSRIACVDSWSGSQNNAKFDRRDRVTVWEFKSGKLLHEWIAPDNLLGWRSGLRWLPGDTQLMAFGSDRAAVLNAADGVVLKKFDGTGVLSFDRTELICLGGGVLTTYDLATGDKRDAFAVPSMKYLAEAMLSRDGRWFAAGAMGQVPVIVDLKNRRALAPSADGHARQPYSVAYTTDGRLMVHDGGATRMYDDESGRVLRAFKPGVYCVYGGEGATRDGRLLLTKGDAGGRAELWDTVRGELVAKLPKGSGAVQGTYLSPDGAWAATQGERSGMLQFWDLKTGQALGKLVGPQHSFFGRTLQVTGLAWNADGSKVFLTSSNGAWFAGEKPKAPGIPDLLHFTGAFDPRAGTLIYAFEMPDEKAVGTAEVLDYFAPEDLVFVGTATFCGLWKGADGKFFREVEKPGAGARFTADGRRLVGPDAVVDAATGKAEKSFKFGKHRIVSPGGTLIAAFDEDQKFSVHEARTGEELLARDLGPCKLMGKILTVAWHPAEDRIAVTMQNQPAVVQVELPEVLTKGVDAEVRRSQAARIRELRARNAKVEPMKVDWK